MQMLPPIKNWGVDQKKKKIEIIWMTLPEVSKALRIFKLSGCKHGCKGGYTCRKIELPCTELWKCSGKCSP